MIILTSCESGGDLQFINRTSHNVYVTLEGRDEVVIPGSDIENEVYNTHTYEIDTDTQSFLTGVVKERIEALILGETFRMYNPDTQAFTDSTILTIKAGQNLKAFIDPNRASIKIVNNSSKDVFMAEVYKHNFTSDLKIGQMDNILKNTERFIRVDYATPSNSFYYYVVVTMEDGEQFTWGNAQNILTLDEQFLITIEDLS
jgi:hypothetical protein